MLYIRLLGEFSLVDDEQPIGSLTDRLQSLLAYLILHQDTPQSRQRISFHLWPDCTDTQARTKLRKALNHLRHTLPTADHLIITDFKILQWQPQIPLSLDLAHFKAAITAQTDDLQQARSALQQAVAEYRGELLPNCQDEWIVPERERLQQMYTKALEQLIHLAESQHDYREALDYAQRLLRLDTFNEATYCTLMRLYALSGDRANALQVYHRCMTILREELGVDPGTTTRQLYEHLLREDELSIFTPSFTPVGRSFSLVRINSRAPELPLVGRDREWKTIQDWINPILRQDQSFTTQQTANVLLLMGEPGIGKTRLLEELRNILQAAKPVQVLWGRGFAPEMVRPYGIWIDALRSIALPINTLPSELGFLLPELGQATNITPDSSLTHLRERSHLFDAMVHLLATWTNQAPIVVMFDDIQWIDEASSALLHYAIRLLNHLPIQVVCTGRSKELQENEAVSKFLQALRREKRMQILELQPLNRAQTLELIRHAPMLKQAELTIELVDRVFNDSGGNPLFALEVAQALAQNHPTQADTLESLIHDRLQRLDETAREFLSWAAAFGRSFQPMLVGQIADYPLSKLLMAIEQLEQQAVIRPSGAIGSELSSSRTGREPGYDFSHDIVRQVVYQQLSEPRRCLVHWQIAHHLYQCFTQSNSPSSAAHGLASDIAHHAALAGNHELAASTALTAAEQCLKLFAYAEAAEMAQRGIQHCHALDDRTRIRLHLRLLQVLNLAGVTGDRAAQLEQDVQQLRQEAIRLGLKEEEAIGLEILMLLNVNQSNYADLHEHSLRATEISRVCSPATAAHLLAYSGSCWAEIGREMHRAEALLREAESLAARVEIKPIDLLCGLGCLDSYYAHYAEARIQLQQALQLAQAEQDHWRECNILSYLAMTELESGHPVTALPYCHEMARVSAKIQGEGSEGAIATALAALANYQLQRSEAEADLERAITLLYQVDAKRMLSYVLIGAAEVDLANHQVERAATRAEAALQAAQIINQPCEIVLAGTILVQTALALGEPDRATNQWEFLQTQIDRHALSNRAKTTVDRALEHLQSFFAVPP
ncbi:MAG: AAA family ATPase [Elainellaceae cyanobacterium]